MAIVVVFHHHHHRLFYFALLLLERGGERGNCVCVCVKRYARCCRAQNHIEFKLAVYKNRSYFYDNKNVERVIFICCSLQSQLDKTYLIYLSQSNVLYFWKISCSPAWPPLGIVNVLTAQFHDNSKCATYLHSVFHLGKSMQKGLGYIWTKRKKCVVFVLWVWTKIHPSSFIVQLFYYCKSALSFLGAPCPPLVKMRLSRKHHTERQRQSKL